MKFFWLLLAILLTACGPSTPKPASPIPVASPTAIATPTTRSSQPAGQGIAPAPPAKPTFKVTRVIDGDTIELEGGQTVRYIGIDTPETVAPNRPVDCFGPEASAKNKELVQGKSVELEKDVSETDRFGRLLRYVYIDGQMVNELLVAEGYAQSSTFPPDVKYQDKFRSAQQKAMSEGKGLWTACAATATPAPPPTPTRVPALSAPTVRPQPPAPTATPERGANCHPSYPDVCIPPPPPDLDCPEIPFKRFRVVGSDPHRLDGNRDGIGCEN